jgi:hypothetical protein
VLGSWGEFAFNLLFGINGQRVDADQLWIPASSVNWDPGSEFWRGWILFPGLHDSNAFLSCLSMDKSQTIVF